MSNRTASFFLIITTWTSHAFIISTITPTFCRGSFRLYPDASVVITESLSVNRLSFRSPTWTVHDMSSNDNQPEEFVNDDEEDDNDVEPGQMRVSEIKAELELRGIPYKDCFDKESLVGRLITARATGKADPTIIDKFNRQKLEDTVKDQKLEVRDEDIEKVLSNDGKMPGGMSPEIFKKLSSNPELMTLLQSTKMQEAMKLMMTGGREELQKAVAQDPELQEVVAKLDRVMRSIQ